MRMTSDDRPQQFQHQLGLMTSSSNSHESSKLALSMEPSLRYLQLEEAAQMSLLLLAETRWYPQLW